MLSIIVAFCTALAYVFSGMYGDISSIGTLTAMGIVIQLFIAGVLVILLDECMQKGYGIGSGVSLFIATNICESIFWRALSPITIKTENGIEFEGAIVNMIHMFIVKDNKLYALHQSFYRGNSANMHNVLATVFMFFVIIYFQGFKVDIKLSHMQRKGVTQPFPIKLFYLSSTPIILQTALVSNLHFFSHILYKKFKTNPIIRLFGVWQENDMSGQGQAKLIGGLAYYLTPPNSMMDVIYNPSHAFFYFTFVLISCALFSKLWLEMSGRSPKDVLNELVRKKMFIAGRKQESIIHVLNQYIPVAAAFGGMCIGLITICSDVLGAIGSGRSYLKTRYRNIACCKHHIQLL